MRDGLETHDLAAMEAWFLDSLKEFAHDFAIRAIAVTTHGATFVCTDEKAILLLPVFITHTSHLVNSMSVSTQKRGNQKCCRQKPAHPIFLR